MKRPRELLSRKIAFVMSITLATAFLWAGAGRAWGYHEERDDDRSRYREDAAAQPDEDAAWGTDTRPLPEHEVLAFLKEHMPYMHDRLRQLRHEDARRYREHLAELSDRIHQYREMKSIAPAVAEGLLRSHRLEYEAEQLAQEISQTQNRKQREIKEASLRETLVDVFELRLKEPELEIRMMEEEIAEIKRVIERRKENRDRIVAHRMRELIGETQQELGWW